MLGPTTATSASKPGPRAVRRRLLPMAAALTLLTGAAAPALASAGPATKVVAYHGYRLTVPAAWPVYNLSGEPSRCVRFDRHALYLGLPGAHQSCPAHAAGRTEAILVSPLAKLGASADTTPRALPAARTSADGGWTTQGRVIAPRQGVAVTATWGQQPAVIERALGVHSLGALAAPSSQPAGTASGPTFNARMSASAPGGIYTGSGFDTCSTPSSGEMSAWSSSPYRGIGVYIGGLNMACSQPYLTSGWVSRQSGAGWHLIPIYVGRQAPANSCGCAPISTNTSTAAGEGSAEASDAIGQAHAVGLGAGNPIYDDMEYYDRGSYNTPPVMAFLSAWTARLHASGYKSGVYGNPESAIADMVALLGTSFSEPDVVWFANWNYAQDTYDPVLSSHEWANHQRIHQYSGGENQTYGGVTLNVDGDYIDARTAAFGTVTHPKAKTLPTVTGTPRAGLTLAEHHATWSVRPSSYSYSWKDCDSTGAHCAAIPGAHGQRYTLQYSDIGHTIRVAETASAYGTSGKPAVSKATAKVRPAPPGYWLFSRRGNVWGSPGSPWYGSPDYSHLGLTSIVGMATTSDGRGYVLASSSGAIYSYGDAPHYPQVPHTWPPAGVVVAPGRGLWLFSARGDVYRTPGTPWYGSPYGHLGGSPIVGMTATRDGKGYWLVNAAGTVFAYGDARRFAPVRHAYQIVGIVRAPSGGYWLFSAHGNVYGTSGAHWYGSPNVSHLGSTSIVDMASTPAGKGYWLVSSTGAVYAYGDATRFPPVNTHSIPVAGISAHL